ncbi:MAG: ThiF family adenylyltransferase, partial [Clostridia bacterium]|nr:ThiF family adenylyltransferase [Clostridia bacterium]
MDYGQHTRSVPLLGEQGLFKLQNAKVAVFGVGGVGGHLCEALARAGVG